MSRARVGCHLGCLGCSVPLLAVLAVLVVLLSACGGSHPNAAACKSALKAELAAAITSGTQGTEPAACKGLSNAEIRKLVGQVISERLGGQ